MLANGAVAVQVRRSWADRRLLLPMGRRLLQRTIAATILGPIWWVLRPLFRIVVQGLVFGSIVDVDTGGIPYLVFLMVGNLGWSGFSHAWTWTTRSVDVQSRLIRRFDVPFLLVALSGNARSLVDLSFWVVMLVLTLFGFGLYGDWYLDVAPTLLAVPLGVIAATALGFGLGLSTAMLNARWRDARLALRFVLDGVLYLSPVLYQPSALPGPLGEYAWLNPLTGAIGLLRYGMGHEPSPGTKAVVMMGVWTVVFLGIGLWHASRIAERRPLVLSSPRIAVSDEDDED